MSSSLTHQQILDIIAKAAQKRRTSLVLSGLHISELPDEIGQLSNLRRLDLDSNLLTMLPEFIGRLVNLESLGLAGNKLTALPESIGKLVNLEALDLRFSQLTALPDSIGQLVNLESLDLVGNQLTALPTSLAQLKKLQKLHLGDSPLNPALKSAYAAGLDALRAYLRSLQEPAHREELYEAKLPIFRSSRRGSLLRNCWEQRKRLCRNHFRHTVVQVLPLFGIACRRPVCRKRAGNTRQA